ncbi:uncharacterized protein LOC133187007 [Saccostrea echinata]|uniref:uncharacterized protein LOC133187007 n=1 Tax=Saccostrea echinata TaxID=191078 RepID=UPI002A822EAC|nr:uncharacterized protein LOC133187007 [Saccostrea echinata]
MAASKPKYSLGSPQEHIEMCKTHDLPIDVICEDCDEFICGKCVKTDHRDHDWSTIPTAASQRKRALLKFLTKIKEEDLPRTDERIKKISKQITENKELCDTEIRKLQIHYDEVIARLLEIKENKEQNLRDNLKEKNELLNDMKSELNKKKKEITKTVKFIEDNKSAMSDYSLIVNHRELTQLLSDLDIDIRESKHSLRYRKGEISDEVLNTMIGKTLDLKDISLTETSSFEYDEGIFLLKAFSEDQCYVKLYQSAHTEKVNTEGETKHKYNINPDDLCVTDTDDVYYIDSNNKSISCLSPSGSVSTVISTDSLEPEGICQSVDSGLLVTLTDKESDDYKLDSNSRRLVRHITVTGDVIHEYEYQEDGQTRLFTLPVRVTQNSNSDICVVNHTSDNSGDLVIMSPSGHVKSVYRGENLTENFDPSDVACDSLCNILVTDPNNNQIYLLSPEGKFLKFLLTKNKVICPVSLSLHKTTLCKCARTDHRDHEWNTLSTAASQRRRGLHKFLTKIKQRDLPVIDEKKQKISKQISEN